MADGVRVKVVLVLGVAFEATKSQVEPSCDPSKIAVAGMLILEDVMVAEVACIPVGIWICTHSPEALLVLLYNVTLDPI